MWMQMFTSAVAIGGGGVDVVVSQSVFPGQIAPGVPKGTMSVSRMQSIGAKNKISCCIDIAPERLKQTLKIHIIKLILII